MQWKCNGRMGAQRASLTLIQSVQAVFESEYSSTWSAPNNLIWQSTDSKPYNAIQVGSYFGYTTRLLSHLFKRAGKPTINLGCLTWKKFWNLFDFFSGKCRVVHGHPLCVHASSFVCFKHIQKSFCIQYVRCIILYMFVGAHSQKCKWIHHFPCKYQCILCRRHTLLGKDLVPYSLKVIALDAIPELLQVPWAL